MDAEQARRDLTEERRRLVEVGDFADGQRPDPAEEQEGASGQHAADYGTEVEEQMENQGLSDEARRQVGEIDAALARLDEGTWGLCVVDGKEIDGERLEALPYAARCREHQEELERSTR